MGYCPIEDDLQGKSYRFQRQLYRKMLHRPEIEELLSLKSKIKVLEIGCGVGIGVIEMFQMFGPSRCCIVALEATEHLLNIAKQSVEEKGEITVKYVNKHNDIITDSQINSCNLTLVLDQGNIREEREGCGNAESKVSFPFASDAFDVVICVERWGSYYDQQR